MADELLPIKVILHSDDFIVANEPGGSAAKIFDEVSPSIRSSLIDQVVGVQEAYESQFQRRSGVPAVAKVRLKEKALAKSHRPDRLFSDYTCPIIGVGGLRELFVRVTRNGLSSLAIQMRSDESAEGRANISTISEIAAITTEERLGARASSDVTEVVERVDRDGLVKARLFTHGDTEIDRAVREDFLRYLEEIDAELVGEHQYASELTVYVIRAKGPQLLEIAEHPGIRRASFMPRFASLRHRSLPVPDPESVSYPVPSPDEFYPIVAVVDSGISSNCAPLQPWVQSREEYVAAGDEDPEHGTFVGGLITFAAALNPQNSIDTGGPCRLIDVAVLPRSGDLAEHELVSALQELTARYSGVAKVWNLSLGSDRLCTDESFSDLGRALDELQQKYGVQFVLAAGNYEDTPLRGWPPEPTIGDQDRICAPADSVLGLTVGSIANCQNGSSRVKLDEPSPFSRRGPAPAYLVKPELVHYGGNCDVNGDFVSTGVRSLFPDGRIAEDAGTSFSAPLISSLMANIISGLEPPPSINVAKALLVHAAEYPRRGDESHINYFGFGKPDAFASIVYTTQSAATLVFEDEIEPGNHLELDPFPYPACLIKNGRAYGRIKMTLVYDPPLDSNCGLEYCRANIDASLGTMRLDARTGKLRFQGEVPPEPNLRGLGYEEDLVKFGFKWSPVKSYRRTLSRGVASDRWRLRVSLLHRHEHTPQRQRFALVITIRGEEGEFVYDDVVAALRSYATVDMQLRTSVQQRIRARQT